MAIIPLDKFSTGIPVRYVLWVMIFTCCWVSYMVRVNISVNIIAMAPEVKKTSALLESIVNETRLHEDITDVRAAPRPSSGSGSFDWDADQQALILGSYFWSYPLSSLVGGMAAERWGPRKIVFITTVLSGLLTVLSPPAANLHYLVLVVVRCVLGLMGGFIYPSLHALVARWAPPTEKGKFISAMMGGTLGTVVTWSLTGIIIEKMGWEAAFYIPGVLTVLWCAAWWYLVSDTPGDHPRISEEEKNYISQAIGDRISKTKGLPPLKKIMTSLPFFAMIVLHYGNLWGLYFVMTVGPKFMSSALGFKLAAAGALSALPYLARLFFSFIFGAIGDCILAKSLMATTMTRKFFCLFSHIVPGLFLVLLTYVGSTAAVSVTLITLSMGSNGAATLTNLQNHQDLAPNYAGSLYGIANAIGSTAGFFTPMITAFYTRNGTGFEEWRPVFFIGAGVYIVAAIFFMIFGKGEVQPWNNPSRDTESTDTTKKSSNWSTPLKMFKKKQTQPN